MSQFNYALCYPKDLDLAVPGSPNTLLKIMANYPLSWERASNCSYHSPVDSAGNAGTPVGLLAERGSVYSWNPPGWPALFVKDGRAWFLEDGTGGAATADMALGAGPMLVRSGKVTDIPGEIRKGDYSGFSTTDRKPQVGIGIRGDGMLVHAIDMDATLWEFAERFVGVGCVAAMKLDSGGSTGLLQKGLVSGWSLRKITAGLVIRQVVLPTPLQPEPEPEEETPTTPSARINAIQISPNFTLSEFASRDTDEVKLDPRLLSKLQAMRTAAGRPITVNSGYRTPEHNGRVGGSPGSQHLYGRAADIVITGLTPERMADMADKAGFDGIGIYSWGIHVDVRGSKSRWRG